MIIKDTIQRIGARQTFRKFGAIIEPWTQPGTVYLVQEGVVLIRQTCDEAENFSERRLAIERKGPGMLINAVEAWRERPYRYSAKAATPVTCLSCDASILKSVIKRQGKMFEALEELLDEADRTATTFGEQLGRMMFMGAAERTRLVMEEAGVEVGPGGLSRAMVGELAGISREMVRQALLSLESEGEIKRVNGSLVVAERSRRH
jgi:CRP-like cAMP-binding protein